MASPLVVKNPARWDKSETPPDKVILTITRAMQGMSHSNIEKLGKALCMGLKAYQSCFYWGFIKKRQKYGTLSKDFWVLLLHPKENMSKNIINALLFLYYWKRSRTDDWEENLTNMFHYSGNYLPRNTELSVNTCRVACPIYLFFEKIDKCSFASGFFVIALWKYKKTEFWSFGLVTDWCNKTGLRYFAKRKEKHMILTVTTVQKRYTGFMIYTKLNGWMELKVLSLKKQSERVGTGKK